MMILSDSAVTYLNDKSELKRYSDVDWIHNVHSMYYHNFVVLDSVFNLHILIQIFLLLSPAELFDTFENLDFTVFSLSY